MLDCDAVYDRFLANGIRCFAGVPDSLLKPLCACIAHRAPDHVIAANEGNALAIAVGHHIGTGEVPLVYLQNSGHGNLINPLLSLADPSVYGVPVVILIGWRGRPGGDPDAAQHHAQGARTEALLAATETPARILPDTMATAGPVIDEVAAQARRASRPIALLVPDGLLAPWSPARAAPPSAAEPGSAPPNAKASSPTREAAIAAILDSCPPNAVLVSTTGKASRELFELRRQRGEGHARDVLVVGSMGHASSVALGLARARPDRPVWCLDGDGAALMHLGALAVTGTSGAANLVHVVLNNGAHDSVGGQPTVGFEVDLCRIAAACGYVSAARVDRADALAEAAKSLAAGIDHRAGRGPRFLEVRIRRGARPDLGRPDVPAAERLRRLRAHLDDAEES